jgi:SAM-dependent methyltransferase
MLKNVLPKRVNALVRRELARLVSSVLPYHQGFAPHQGTRPYVVPQVPREREFHPLSSLPVPPSELWVGYGATPDEYLSIGRYDVETMERLVGASGAPLASCGRILELGCAAGRMIRWLVPWTDTCEVWGTDVDATSIIWCQQHLSPPFHFATTTLFPHLPFEDRYFGLVYAGSVFTHIDDLADAWFLELRRVLRPGGRLFVTLHDRRTVAILDAPDDERPWVGRFRTFLGSFPEYEAFSRSNFGMFSLRTPSDCQVFYDIGFLRKKLAPFFRVLSVTEEAYGYQTALLLERV